MEHLLYEYCKGYLLFELKEFEDLSNESYANYLKLTQVVYLKSKYDFDDIDISLRNIKSLCNNKLPDELEKFLELNNVKILHCDPSLKLALQSLNIKHKYSINIMRGIRINEHKFLKEENDLQFTLGISHKFSRDKVEYNIKKEDNLLVHTVSMLDQLDKDINSYCMRIKELYGWSFPELFDLCDDNDEYIEAVQFSITGQSCLSSEKIKIILEHKTNSIGIEINELDIKNVLNLCSIVSEKIKNKIILKEYLKEKMDYSAPNLSEFLGDIMTARIIMMSGGLLNLAKATASTIQLLGAEKSLFQALKNRSNTPKYGVLYYSKYVIKIKTKNKAKLSRCIASKIAVLAKIDYFSQNRTRAYGKAIRKLIDKKTKYYENGKRCHSTDIILSKIYKKIQEC